MSDANILDKLYAVLEQRRDAATSETSYVKSLLEAGPAKVCAKITEEAGEVVAAADESDPSHFTHEVADLIFHLWVLMLQQGVTPDAVFAELQRRFGTSGHEEKASRPPGGAS